jgi:hypothetical protein
MAALQIGKGALQRAAAERNVRSILFHVSPAAAKEVFGLQPGVKKVGGEVVKEDNHGRLTDNW